MRDNSCGTVLCVVYLKNFHLKIIYEKFPVAMFLYLKLILHMYFFDEIWNYLPLKTSVQSMRHNTYELNIILSHLDYLYDE